MGSEGRTEFELADAENCCPRALFAEDGLLEYCLTIGVALLHPQSIGTFRPLSNRHHAGRKEVAGDLDSLEYSLELAEDDVQRFRSVADVIRDVAERLQGFVPVLGDSLLTLQGVAFEKRL